jgi:hypothetical protein
MAWLYLSKRPAVAAIVAACWPPSLAAFSRAAWMSALRLSKRCLHLCLHSWQVSGGSLRENDSMATSSLRAVERADIK